MTLQREKVNKVAHQIIKYPFLHEIEESQIISPANYSAHAGDVEWVEHCASADAGRYLEPDVDIERHKPFCVVGRALVIRL